MIILRIHQNAMKGILPNLSIGLGYAYDNHYNIAVEESDTVILLAVICLKIRIIPFHQD